MQRPISRDRVMPLTGRAVLTDLSADCEEYLHVYVRRLRSKLGHDVADHPRMTGFAPETDGIGLPAG